MRCGTKNAPRILQRNALPYFTEIYKITGRANRPVIIFQVLLNAKALTSDAS